MNARTKEVLNDGTLAANLNASGTQGIDPRRRRFALNPGIYMAMLEPRESGRQEVLLPSGLIPFRTAQIANDDFDNALKNGHNRSARSRQVVQEIPARDFLRNALIRYAEVGMRELTSLTMMDDPEPNAKGKINKEEFIVSAQGYFAALWPSFADIGHGCPAELDDCVTCRLWLIGDPEKGEDMQPALLKRIAELDDQRKVVELREEIVDCLKTRLDWLTRKWAELVGELADRKNGAPAIAKLGVAEHHIRRHLHEVEPSESATAASFGAEVARENAEATRELAAAFREGKGGSSDEVMKLILETQKQQAEILARLAEKLPAETK